MTIKLIIPPKLKHVVGTKIRTSCPDIFYSDQTRFFGKPGKITEVHDGMNLFGVPKVFSIDVDCGMYYWFIEELELIK